MSEIRLLFVSLPAMLSGILRQSTNREPDFQVIEEVTDVERLAEVVARTRPDVLVVGSNGGRLPRECARVLYELPGSGVLAVSLDGSLATSYRLRPHAVTIENASSRGIVDAIRDLALPPQELRA